MKKLLPIAILIGSSLLSPLRAQTQVEDNSTLYVMYKFYGVCSFIENMKSFQNGIKMDGADEFIQKIVKYQAARHGSTIEEQKSICDKAAIVVAKTEEFNVEQVPFEDLSEYLLLSELTGYCGMFNISSQVLNSESDSQFLLRFLSTELVKRDISDIFELKELCEDSNDVYMKITGQE